MSYTEAFAGKDYPYPIRIDNARLMRYGEYCPRPWTPLGTIVVGGISIVPQRQASWIDVDSTGAHRRALTGMAADLAADLPTGSLPESLVIFGHRFTDPADVRLYWSMLADSDRAEQVERDRREHVNARVADVFHQARESRLERAQVQDPGVRDALSLT